jgi:hypothetical protein
MFPLVLHPLHELLESLLAVDVGQEGIFLCQQGIVDKATIDRMLQLVQ